MPGPEEYVGEVLDEKYRLEHLLGKGGMGAVYLATHLGTERYGALKLISPQFMRNNEFVERFIKGDRGISPIFESGIWKSRKRNDRLRFFEQTFEFAVTSVGCTAKILCFLNVRVQARGRYGHGTGFDMRQYGELYSGA